MTFKCNSDPSQKVLIVLYIKPVNDMTPLVKGNPINISIPESTEIGKEVFNFSGRIEDFDCPKTPFIYSMGKYFITDIDGSKYFSVNKTSGKVTLKTKIDASDIYCQNYARYLSLNIIVQDMVENPRSASSRIDITVTEVDDEPPVFVNNVSCNVCNYKCRRTSYQTQISTSFMGQLSTKIYAKDFDTTGADITYGIVKVEPEDLAFLINLNERSGVLTVPVAPINHTNLTLADDFGIMLTIQALENKTQAVSDNVTVKVTFVKPTTTTSTTTTTTTTTASTIATTTTNEKTTELATTELSTAISSTTLSTAQLPSTSTSASKPSPDVLQGINVLVIVLPVVFGVLLLTMILAIIYQYKQSLPAKGKIYEVQNGELKPMPCENIKMQTL